MEFINDIGHQFDKSLKFHGLNMKKIQLSFMEDKFIRVTHDEKFLFYLNMSNFTRVDLMVPISQKWKIYKNNIINTLIKHIRKSPIFYDTICIIPVYRNHNILLKCISSIEKQIRRPHLILSVCTKIDKLFAIRQNLEFVMANRNILGVKLQAGIHYIKNNYKNVVGIGFSTGCEIFPETWFSEVIKLSSNFDFIGIDRDYIVDKYSNTIYRRTLNQQKYGTYLKQKYKGLYLMLGGQYIRKDIFNKLNWSVFSARGNGVEMETFKKICDINPKIGKIENSIFITVYQGSRLNYSIRYLMNKKFIIAEQLNKMPPNEDTIMIRCNLLDKDSKLKNNNQLVISTINHDNTKSFSTRIIRKYEKTNKYTQEDDFTDMEVTEDEKRMLFNKIKKNSAGIIFSNKHTSSKTHSKEKKNNIVIKTDTEYKVKKDDKIIFKATQNVTRNVFVSAKPIKPEKLDLGKRFNVISKPVKTITEYKISINDFFDHVFVINMGKREDKMVEVDELLTRYNIDYERINGIDGEYPIVKKEFEYLVDSQIKTTGAYGCLLSHIKTLELARKRGYSNILIFEDDIIFHNNFNNLLSKLVVIPSDWSIIYLGCSQKQTVINMSKGSDGFYLAKDSRGAFAYSVKKEYYTDILKLWTKRDKSVDAALGEFQKKKKCYVLYPNLVISYVNKSDTQTSGNMISYSNSVKWNLDNYQYWGNSMMYKISIVLPTLNGYPHIQRSIKSIFTQTYKNWELIIVNDGSTQRELKNYLTRLKHSKVKILNLPKNTGLPNALNEGIKKCTGTYWTWISDDNEFKNNCFNELKLKLDDGHDFVYSDYNLVYAYDGLTNKQNKTGMVLLADYTYQTIIKRWRGMPCYLWKMELINKIGLFNIDLYGVEDFDYVIRTFVACDNPGYVNKSLMKYYRRNNTITSRLGDKIKTLKDRVTASYENIEIYRKICKMVNHSNPVLFMIYNKKYIDTYKKICNELSNFKCLCVIKDYQEKISYHQSTVYVSKNMFDEFLKKFNIFDGPSVLVYDNLYFKRYENIMETYLRVFSFVDPDITITSSIREHINEYDILLTLNDTKSKITNYYNNDITDNENKFKKLLDSIIIKNNRKYTFTIGLIGDMSQISYKFEKEYVESIFKHCKIVKLAHYPVSEIDFIVIMCDSNSLRFYWKKKYVKKNIYIINLRLFEKDDMFLTEFEHLFEHKNLRYIGVDSDDTKNWLSNKIKKYIWIDNNLIIEKYSVKNSISKICDVCIFIENTTNIDLNVLKNLYNFCNDKHKINILSLSNNDLVKFKNLPSNVKIKIIDKTDEIVAFLFKSSIVYTDNYFISLICLIHGITVVNLLGEICTKDIYSKFKQTEFITTYSNEQLENYIEKNNYKLCCLSDNKCNISVNKLVQPSIKKHNFLENNVLKKLLLKVIKDNLKIIHFGSYWQYDNDIVKLMVDDLKSMSKTLEVDIKILYGGNNINDWFYNYEPDPIKHPGKLIRYLIDHKVKSVIEKFKPNVVITNSGGITFTNRMFKYLKKNNIATVGISLSDPDVFPYNGKIYADKYDYFYTNSKYSLENDYENVNIKLLPFGCSARLHKPLNIQKKYDVVVVGGARQERIDIIDELKKNFSVGVYGAGWPQEYNSIKVNGIDHVEALNTGDIYISFAQTTAGHMNVKVGLFEAAACKLAIITNDFDEISDYFNVGTEIITYKDIGDLIYRIKFLKNDKNRLNELKEKSYRRFINDHQWTKRWENQLVDLI
jgi:glycosyltransferase involved in cell wall biosynthesis